MTPSPAGQRGPVRYAPPQPSRDRRDTDPGLWPYGNINLEALQAAQRLNANQALARWFEQMARDGSGQSLLHAYGEHEELSAIYLGMKDLGRAERKKTVTALHADYGLRQTADPDMECNYSEAAIIHKLCVMHGIDLVRMKENHKLIAAEYGGPGKSPVYAFLHTFSTTRAPELAVDIHPLGFDYGPYSDYEHWAANTARWAWAAACCLAAYLYDNALYTGRGAPVHIIAPFDLVRDKNLIPHTHAFAKALLLIRRPCPGDWLCGCNEIQNLLTQVPEDHPFPTGVLPSGVVRTTANGYGTPASPSRGLTPPNGTRLHEYNQQRRTTDPNLRNPNEQ